MELERVDMDQFMAVSRDFLSDCYIFKRNNCIQLQARYTELRDTIAVVLSMVK